MQHNLKALTSLRFFASAAIVVFHIQAAMFDVPSYTPLALGVSFFFVLSGFILTYAHRDGLDLRTFYRSRIARLWPVHLATLLLTVVLIGQAPLLPSIANALLLQAWVPVVGYVFSLNAVAWSISVEVFFYLLFPGLRGRWLWPVTAVAAVFTITSLVILDYVAAPILPFLPVPPVGNFWSVHFVLQFPVMRLLEFATGVAFGKLFLSKRIETTTTMEALCVLAIVVFALFLEPVRDWIVSLGWSHVAMWFDQSGGMLIFAVAIYVFAHQGGWISKMLQSRGLVLLGEISFSTYMLHQIVINYLMQFGFDRTPVILLAIPLIYGGSYLLWQYVEKPGRRLIFWLSQPIRPGSLLRQPR